MIYVKFTGFLQVSKRQITGKKEGEESGGRTDMLLFLTNQVETENPRTLQSTLLKLRKKNAHPTYKKNTKPRSRGSIGKLVELNWLLNNRYV